MEESKNTLLALFADLEPAATAVERLRDLGLAEGEMNIISGVPLNAAMLGRDNHWTNVPRLALGGSILGFLFGIFLMYGTPTLYPVSVGGQPLFHGPLVFIVIFEMTMLGMLLSTFLGVFLDSFFPNYRPLHYVSAISDGKIAILFSCPANAQKKFIDAMKSVGAQSVEPAEAQQL